MSDFWVDSKVDEIIQDNKSTKKLITNMIFKYHISPKTIDNLLDEDEEDEEALTRRICYRINQAFTDNIKEENVKKALEIFDNHTQVQYIIDEFFDPQTPDYSGKNQINFYFRNICANSENDPESIGSLIDIFTEERLIHSYGFYTLESLEQTHFSHNYYDYFISAVYNGALKIARYLYWKYNICGETALLNQLIYGESCLEEAKIIWEIIHENKKLDQIRHFSPKELFGNVLSLKVIQWYHSVSPFSPNELERGLEIASEKKEKEMIKWFKALPIYNHIK